MKKYLLAAAMLVASTAQAETLSITVNGVLPAQGNVRVGLFNGPEQFPDGTFYKGVVAESSGTTITIEIPDLAAGQYVVSVFQDVDGTETLDKNFFGMPKEPYGFSGSWKSGGASYQEALLTLPSGCTEITINMK